MTNWQTSLTTLSSFNDLLECNPVHLEQVCIYGYVQVFNLLTLNLDEIPEKFVPSQALCVEYIAWRTFPCASWWQVDKRRANLSAACSSHTFFNVCDSFVSAPACLQCAYLSDFRALVNVFSVHRGRVLFVQYPVSVVATKGVGRVSCGHACAHTHTHTRSAPFVYPLESWGKRPLIVLHRGRVTPTGTGFR